MSIAVSTVVKPSRLLLLTTLAMCLGCAAVGILIGLYSAINVHYLSGALRLLLAAACLSVAVLGTLRIFRGQTTQHLDISGVGQIRLRILPMRSGYASTRNSAIGSPYATCQLLPTSTLWSHLLILNLQAENGVIRTLVILPDTLPKTSFRALAVACHWIAAHNNRADCEKT